MAVEHVARIVVHLVVTTQVAGIVVGVDAAPIFKPLFHRVEMEIAGSHFPRDHLADVLDRRNVFIVVLQRVVGVRVGGDDSLNAGCPDGLCVVIAQRHGTEVSSPNRRTS